MKLNAKPKILERDITKSIRDYLKFKRVLHWKQWQGLGSTPGVPDIVGCINGRFISIEIKTPKGVLSEKQLLWKQMIEDAGGIYILARCVDDVVRILEPGRRL